MTLRPHRPARSIFLAFMVAAWGALLLAPLAVQERGKGHLLAGGTSASAGASRAPAEPTTFERCDRNGDGVLDKVEFGRCSGK